MIDILVFDFFDLVLFFYFLKVVIILLNIMNRVCFTAIIKL